MNTKIEPLYSNNTYKLLESNLNRFLFTIPILHIATCIAIVIVPDKILLSLEGENFYYWVWDHDEYYYLQFNNIQIAIIAIYLFTLLFNVLHSIKFVFKKSNNKIARYSKTIIHAFIILPIIELFYPIYLFILLFVVIGGMINDSNSGIVNQKKSKLKTLLLIIVEILVYCLPIFILLSIK
ncbi:MAG: hypothetical protein R3Y59_05280 [bacterium]